MMYYIIGLVLFQYNKKERKKIIISHLGMVRNWVVSGRTIKYFL